MKFYRFGNADKPVIMLFPGTCCHWKNNFGTVIPMLRKSFHVICASYDGFDETEDGVFPNMTAETRKIERYVNDKLGGRLFAAYGCSLGGSFVGLLIQRGNIRIKHAFIGGSDLDQSGVVSAYLQTKLLGKIIYPMIHTGKIPKLLDKLSEKSADNEEDLVYMRKMLELFSGGGMPFIKKESVENQFFSDLVTPLEDGICAEGTEIHIFYAKKMGEKYLERYYRHFKDPDIAEFDMQHEELLFMYPERWTEEIVKRCGHII